MTAPPKDNALLFVGQIMTAYKQVMKAEGQALKYAIECGEALNRAKENVESTKPKGKWKDWLKEQDLCDEADRQHESAIRALSEALADSRRIGVRTLVDLGNAVMRHKRGMPEGLKKQYLGRLAESMISIINIPPGNALLVVISRSLCECHMKAKPASELGEFAIVPDGGVVPVCPQFGEFD